MPDLTDLLDRTTPTDLAPVDVSGLATLGRRRTQRRRAALAVPLVAVVAALGVVIAGPDDKPTIVGAANLTEPVGVWRQAPDVPLQARDGGESFAGTLSDGRVVVWGGTSDTGDPNDDRVNAHADGALYDPATDTWEGIAPAPLPGIATGGASVTQVQLSQDRLAVVTGTHDMQRISAAVYDFGTRSWTAAPAQSDIPTFFDGMVWDGTTLAVVRVEQGLRFFDIPEARVDAPVTLRWELGADRWTRGTPAPLAMRFGAGTDAADGQLALWGGLAEGGAATFADGAIYNLAGDTWTPIAPSPLRGRGWVTVAWRDGRLLIGSGQTRRQDAGDNLSDSAWYDPATSTWTGAPSAPIGGIAARGDYVVAESTEGHSGPQPIWFLGPDGWELAPLRDLHTVNDLTVATSLPFGNPGDGRFEIAVRADPDVWLRAAEAPFTNRMDALIVATGNKLVVVGGQEGKELTPTTETWVWDLEG